MASQCSEKPYGFMSDLGPHTLSGNVGCKSARHLSTCQVACVSPTQVLTVSSVLPHLRLARSELEDAPSGAAENSCELAQE
eukprot:6179559-Pleurochrysis_carterae.AAC.6